MEKGEGDRGEEGVEGIGMGREGEGGRGVTVRIGCKVWYTCTSNGCVCPSVCLYVCLCEHVHSTKDLLEGWKRDPAGKQPGLVTEASIQVCVQLGHMLVQARPDLAAYKVRDGWAEGRR